MATHGIFHHFARVHRRKIRMAACAICGIGLGLFLFWVAWAIVAPIPVDAFGLTRIWDAVFFPLFAVYAIGGMVGLRRYNWGFFGLAIGFVRTGLQTMWIVCTVGAVVCAVTMGWCAVLYWHPLIMLFGVGVMMTVGGTGMFAGGAVVALIIAFQFLYYEIVGGGEDFYNQFR
ncbi:hypothetical protein ACFL2D_00730 [Patescibacteria group bacterium]